MGFEFKDERCAKLFYAAAPANKKHITAFAWRESPQTLDNHWTRKTAKMTEEEKDILITLVMSAAEAQSRYRREQEKAGERLCRPKGIAPWFNCGSYYDDLGSTAELKEKQARAQCCIAGCTQPVISGKFIHCEHHFDFHADGRMRKKLNLVHEMRAYYKDHPAIHQLKGKPAVEYMKKALRGMLAKKKELLDNR